jgi:transcription antitermination factor NusG
LSSPERRWYPVQTQAQREGLAARQLENQGYTVFFPRRLAAVRHARRLEYRQRGYFPGYVFVQLDLGVDQWRAVNGTFGVKSLVTFGGRPAAVPSAFINLLRASTDAEGYIALPANFHPGDRVKVLSGPFTDVVGLIDRLEGEARIRILLDLASGAVPLVTGRQNIALAS